MRRDEGEEAELVRRAAGGSGPESSEAVRESARWLDRVDGLVREEAARPAGRDERLTRDAVLARLAFRAGRRRVGLPWWRGLAPFAVLGALALLFWMRPDPLAPPTPAPRTVEKEESVAILEDAAAPAPQARRSLRAEGRPRAQGPSTLEEVPAEAAAGRAAKSLAAPDPAARARALLDSLAHPGPRAAERAWREELVAILPALGDGSLADSVRSALVPPR